MLGHALTIALCFLDRGFRATRLAVVAVACISAVSGTTIARAAPVRVSDRLVLEVDDWWQEIPSPFENTKELVGGRASNGTVQARASITTFKQSSEQAALARLQREARLAGKAEALRVSGRPALRATD